MTAKQSPIPNLKGLVTTSMVRTIGSGSYAATYTPWSKIAELLNEHASGWLPELIPAVDGTVLHRAPKGGYLLIRFRNIDTGCVTPEYVQAVQDNRHKSIAYEQIDSRDISDTSRRGFALAAAAVFNLGIELWTRDKLEDGYSRSLESSDAAPTASSAAVAAKAPSAGRAPTSQKAAAATETPSATAESFLEAALEKGLTTHAAEALSSKLDGNFAGGIARLAEKDEAWVKSYNEANAPKNSAERW
jgi:hypothetical protein